MPNYNLYRRMSASRDFTQYTIQMENQIKTVKFLVIHFNLEYLSLFSCLQPEILLSILELFFPMLFYKTSDISYFIYLTLCNLFLLHRASQREGELNESSTLSFSG